jgi:hypothetical protein
VKVGVGIVGEKTVSRWRVPVAAGDRRFYRRVLVPKFFRLTALLLI